MNDVKYDIKNTTIASLPTYAVLLVCFLVSQKLFLNETGMVWVVNPSLVSRLSLPLRRELENKVKSVAMYFCGTCPCGTHYIYMYM